MSAYGPCFFIARIDGEPLPPDEREELLALVRQAAKALKVKDEERQPAEPRVYDYDGYEKNALGVLLYSGYAYAHMPEELQEDENAGFASLGKRLGKKVAEKKPGLYRFDCYAVED